MATWSEVKGFLKSNYKVQKEEENNVVVLTEFKDGRSQLVWIFRQELSGDVWAEISSPVGIIKPESINAALELLNKGICGGLVKIGDVHAVRHGMPIADLSTDEIAGPLALVAGAADTLEENFIGGDSV